MPNGAGRIPQPLRIAVLALGWVVVGGEAPDIPSRDRAKAAKAAASSKNADKIRPNLGKINTARRDRRFRLNPPLRTGRARRIGALPRRVAICVATRWNRGISTRPRATRANGGIV